MSSLVGVDRRRGLGQFSDEIAPLLQGGTVELRDFQKFAIWRPPMPFGAVADIETPNRRPAMLTQVLPDARKKALKRTEQLHFLLSFGVWPTYHAIDLVDHTRRLECERRHRVEVWDHLLVRGEYRCNDYGTWHCQHQQHEKLSNQAL